MCENAEQAPRHTDVDLPNPAQNVAEFIASVVNEAKGYHDFDKALLAILARHIVKEDPDENAVEFSAARIETLADARASPPKKEHSSGGDNT